ncbi:MAG: MFS transporter [Acetobacteraceae bacterium]|nr:MFS transporter [Acetobacteraceae bacterium]
METSAPDAPRLDAAMRRNLLLLTVCQAIGQSANVIMLSVTALSVVTFFPHREFATLPTTMQHLGVMLGVFPAAALMMRRGRGFGFRTGSLAGMAGAALCAWGLVTAAFLLMCAGGLVLGYAVANTQMYRFAAVELAPPNYRAKVIAWVTTGGVVAGTLGPAIARLTYDAIVPLYLGAYLSMAAIHAVVFLLMGLIRFPPPTRAQDNAVGAQRPLAEIASQPRYAAAVIAGMASWATMMFLMTSSPLAIVGCGLPDTEPPWVIFLHAMGMYVPSFFTGHLITRFGVVRVMAAGAAIMLAGVLVALAGLDAWHFRISLLLNGVGWNFLFIGATTLVTTCYRPAERGRAQALNDFLIFGVTAMSSFLAGVLQERIGWIALNWASLALVLVAFAAVAWLAAQRPRLRPA